MTCEVSSDDPTVIGCTIQFPRSNTSDVPVPSGPSGILSWDDSVPAYVNTGILPFQLENVTGRTLSINGATTPTTIVTLTFGSFRVLVNPPSANYPMADFSISKTNPASNAAIVVVHTAQPATSGNVLQVLWPAGGGIQVQKTLATEDGSYQVTVSGL